jgi:hypothetical protein
MSISLKNLLLTLPALCFGLVIAQPVCAQDAETAEWTTIKADSLDEWSDPGKWWKVEDGMFVAESAGGEDLPALHYLVWDGKVGGDFEIALQYRIQADQPRDAGLNFKVERPFDEELPNLPGYQAELDTGTAFGTDRFTRQGKLFGNIHDGKRGRMFQRSKRVTIKEDGSETTENLAKPFRPQRVFRKPPEWNKVLIRVTGDHVQLFLNDVLANEIIDGDAKNKSTGDGIALQFRPVDAYRYEVKDLKYRLLDQN